MSLQTSSLYLCISGRVQGVFYRASTQQKAQSLGLVGWVRNLPDGRVEVLAEGPKETLEHLANWCETGPPAAIVTRVESDWGEADGVFGSFDIR